MDKDYTQFIAKVKTKLGIDLHLYKETQMKRRLTSLRNKRGYKDFASYYRALGQDKRLLNEFVDRLTINVSEFYRNPIRWEVLQTSVLPKLVEQSPFTIWSAACSTGEEPYSVAMMLAEHFPNASYRIIATDIDEAALDKAKQGIYQKQALKDLPEKFITKYFTDQQGLYYLSPSIKQRVTFRKHNLLADTYPNNIDLIICRNVLIYFTDEAKEEIYQRFSQALNKNGVLFVGSTEQIFHPEKYQLRLLDTFFYQKV
ncbi:MULTISPECIES: CheR family methyltransferase [Virgibacillus]|uniref:protein-glutamate O-methyltransferase n=1 Tax=Virgibacillus pantothenticus TaxID=1473 RepID=A0A0L0QP15_VIRPA|nr:MULTISPECIES: protein-glutamate O-methyltransferase CheR [Virgibacillus]API90407.1 chemotaxis protein CheR [Virgibacillus sp. 6R]KNE20370.1 chemotaxis protein CheR [Virgibacillus pantothenticus]MBS7429511.1 protein-glutamate O-methyltransferase CheR [Virgibacillus sp. 19R1-5]MBU8567883.1 protein-glutamate O-methyltransferase CheR [Virgibacillus pantothenticus]MBU8601676.1 protein-glutamate O-methyltransferase CheR [Virgibacillus pantothenticus]